MDCADLGHLVFLAAGDAALTRRAKKASGLSAVVVRWSRTRKRFERQGILAENDAIELAAQQCLDDADARAVRRERDKGHRAAGRALDPEAIRLAVTASVRHVDTDYDDLLMFGVDRDEARGRVSARVHDILDARREGVITLDD